MSTNAKSSTASSSILHDSIHVSAHPSSYSYRAQFHDDDEVRLTDLWSLIAASKRMIATTVLVTTTIALAFAILSTPMFRAETTLAPVDANREDSISSLAGQYGGLASLAGISLSGGGELETALATLTSRDFLTRFIQDGNLKPALFPDSWKSDAQAWELREPSFLDEVLRTLDLEPPSPADPTLRPGEPSNWDAYEIFIEDVLTVIQDSDTGLITLAVEWEDPTLAADWANLLVQRVNAELRQRAIARAEKSIAYLRDQINETSLADLRTVLFRLIEDHIKTITLAKVTDEFAFEVIDPAVPPEEAAKPLRSLIVIGGFTLGLMLAMFFALVRQTSSATTHKPVVRANDDLSALTPCNGHAPHSQGE